MCSDILVCHAGEEDQGFFGKEGWACGGKTRMNKRCSNRFQGLFPGKKTFPHENIIQMGKDFVNEPFTAGAGIMITPWWRWSRFIKGLMLAGRTVGKYPRHEGNQGRCVVNTVIAADRTIHDTRDVSGISYILCFLK
jgi:hypothetical protein